LQAFHIFFTKYDLFCLLAKLILLYELFQDVLKEVMHEVIDEVTLGLCFEVHRACKKGTLFLADTDPK
jgi:hypothetical protein